MNCRRHSGLVLALFLSLLLHFSVVISPGWYGDNKEDEPSTVLDARLVAVPAAPLPSSPPRAKKVPIPKIAPEVVQDSAPVLTQDTPSAVPEAATDPVPQAATSLATEPEPAEVVPSLPRHGRIQFAISRGDGGFVVGKSVHEWSHDGKRYNLSASSETTGLAALFKAVRVIQTSEGFFVQGDLKPASFRYDQGNGVVETADFDWDAHQVKMSNGLSFPVGDGAEDIVSMFYQLIQAAQRGEGFVMGVTTGKKLERYVFDWLEEDVLELKPGRFHAWHVRIRSVSGGADVTDVWLGREVAGLPIRIRHIDRKGEIFDQRAEIIDYEGK